MYHYFGNSIGRPAPLIYKMEKISNQISIFRFKELVGPLEYNTLETMMGCSNKLCRGLRSSLNSAYFSSEYNGKQCVYAVVDGIFYIYLKGII